jgi:hypothetical protein
MVAKRVMTGRYNHERVPRARLARWRLRPRLLPIFEMARTDTDSHHLDSVVRVF